jgi:hypothetical protein
MVRMTFEYRHYKLLNRLVTAGEEYQRGRAKYVSTADLDDDDDETTDSALLDAERRDAERRSLAARESQKH